MSETPEEEHPPVMAVPDPPTRHLSLVRRRIEVDLDTIEGWAVPLESARQIVEGLGSAVADLRGALGVAWSTVASESGVTPARLRAIVDGGEPSWPEVEALYQWVRAEARKAAES